jgi:formate dehydrogenase maturation protein FdhE
MICPFCQSAHNRQVADFGTSQMVNVHQCDDCHSYFEAIKWSGQPAALDVPAFLDERMPEP